MKTLLVVLALAHFPTWMSGTWRSTEGSVRMEEHWTSADGDLMLGLHRDIGKKTSFEFMRIERQGDTLVYLAMPGGRPATRFPLKSVTADRIVFENPEHDFPQRILYWRDGEKLCARVEGTMNGKEESEQWCWSRVP
ncbi:MAG TPA: DUF6265 family protein [Thermoanaerobaculia bacterium]|nr:DUF6265 family protein [Thermoanaerobaculia bacterium]